MHMGPNIYLSIFKINDRRLNVRACEGGWKRGWPGTCVCVEGGGMKGGAVGRGGVDDVCGKSVCVYVFFLIIFISCCYL